MTNSFALRRVGKTQTFTSEISFGCSGIANLYVEVSEGAAQEVLGYAWDNGIRYFDAAPHYGRGLAETRLATLIRNVERSEVTISTKVGRVLRPGDAMQEADGFINPLPNAVHYDYSGSGILESFEGSCARLGVDYVDIIYVHDIGVMTHGAENARHMADLIDTGLPMLEKLKQEGRIGAIGLGVNECEVCLDVMSHHPLDVILLAGRWTLLDRSAEKELVPLCEKTTTSLVLGGIFNSGILATGAIEGAHYDYAPASSEIMERTRALEEEAKRNGETLAGAALQFGLSKPGVSSVLIGTGKTKSLARNLKVLRGD